MFQEDLQELIREAQITYDDFCAEHGRDELGKETKFSQEKALERVTPYLQMPFSIFQELDVYYIGAILAVLLFSKKLLVSKELKTRLLVGEGEDEIVWRNIRGGLKFADDLPRLEILDDDQIMALALRVAVQVKK